MTIEFKPRRRSQALPPAPVELEPDVDLTDWDAALEREAAKVRVGRPEGLPRPLLEGASLVGLLAVLEEGAHWDPEKHPRWPKDAPGGLGGQFMHVGQRFSLHGVEYDVAAVMPGKIWAHVATLGKHMQGAKPKLVEIDEKELAKVERPAAKPLVGATHAHGATLKTTATVVDAYVHPDTHDPSIPVPEESAIKPEEWKRFGKADQERYSQLQERYGHYTAGEVQKKLDATYQSLAGEHKSLLDSAYSSQYGGGSAGFSLSLHSIWKGLTQLTQSKQEKLESARAKYESAKAAQHELTSILQWDLYNRTHAPDLAIFKGHNDENFFTNDVIKGGEPIYAGASFSQHFRPGFFGSSKIIAPMAIRNVAMSTVSGYATPYHAFQGEQEIAMADPWIADPQRVLSVPDGSTTYGSGGGTHPALTSMQSKWLAKITGKGRGGEIVDELLKSFADGGANLPVPPAAPEVMMDGSGGMQFDDPPAEAKQFGYVLGAKTAVGDMPYAETSPEGKPVAKKVKEMVAAEQLHAGDYIEGMQGTRYIVLPSPSDQYLGLVYYKLTDTGTQIPNTEFTTPETGQSSSAYTGHKPHAGGEVYMFEGGGEKAFKKLAGHYDLPSWSEETTGFHPEAWAEGGKDDEKFLSKFGQGEKFIVAGTPYEVVQPGSATMSQIKIQNLNTAKFGKINGDYKSAPLQLKKGYTETGEATLDPSDFFQLPPTAHGELEPGAYTMIGTTIFKVEPGKTEAEKVTLTHMSGTQVGLQAQVADTGLGTPLVPKPAGWEPPKVGDTFAYAGKRATVSKLLADGQIQAKTAEGSKKLPPNDPAFAYLHRPSAWTLGDKVKLRDLGKGERFHGGTGQKIRPYLVVGHEQDNKVTRVRNLDTGEEMLLSSRKSYTRLLPVQTAATTPAPDHTLPSSPTETYDPEAWTAGPTKKVTELEPGDKFVSPTFGTPYEIISTAGYKGQENLGEVKNLVTGVHGGYHTGEQQTGSLDVATLVPKGADVVQLPVTATLVVNPEDIEWTENTELGREIKDMPIGSLVMSGFKGGIWRIMGPGVAMAGGGATMQLKKVGPADDPELGKVVPNNPAAWAPFKFATPAGVPAAAQIVGSEPPIAHEAFHENKTKLLADLPAGARVMFAPNGIVWQVLPWEKQSDENPDTFLQKVSTGEEQPFSDTIPQFVAYPVGVGPDAPPAWVSNPEGGPDIPTTTPGPVYGTTLKPGDVVAYKSKTYTVTLTKNGEKVALGEELGDVISIKPDKTYVLVGAELEAPGALQPNKTKLGDLPVGTRVQMTKSTFADDDVLQPAVFEITDQSGLKTKVKVASPVLTMSGEPKAGTVKVGEETTFDKATVFAFAGVPATQPSVTKVEPQTVSATTFDPSAYVEAPNEDPGTLTLGDLEAGEVFKGKTGKHFQIKSKSGTNIYATNLQTAKTSKLKSTIKPAAVLFPKAESATPYEQLQPGDPVLLGDLKKGDQFVMGLGNLYEVLEPSAGTDEQNATIGAVAADGSIGATTSDGAHPGLKVKLHAKAADTIDVPAAQTAGMLIDAETLPALDDGTFWDGVSEAPYQGKQAKTMAEGFTFKDKLGVAYVVKQAGPMPIVSDGDKLYQLNGELYVEPVEAPQFPDATPPVVDTHQEVEHTLAAQGLTANTAKASLFDLEIKKGDTFQAGEGWHTNAVFVAQNDAAVTGNVAGYEPATGKTLSFVPTYAPQAWKKGHGEDLIVEEPEAPAGLPEIPQGAMENPLPLSTLKVGTEFTLPQYPGAVLAVYAKPTAKSVTAKVIVPDSEGKLVPDASGLLAGKPLGFKGDVVPPTVGPAGALSNPQAPETVAQPSAMQLPEGLSPDAADWDVYGKTTLADASDGVFFKTVSGQVMMVAGHGESSTQVTSLKTGNTIDAAGITPVQLVKPKESAGPMVGDKLLPSQAKVGDQIVGGNGGTFEITSIAPSMSGSGYSATLKNVDTGVQGAGYYSDELADWTKAPTSPATPAEAPGLPMPLYNEVPDEAKQLTEFAEGDTVQQLSWGGGIYRIKSVASGYSTSGFTVEVVKPGKKNEKPGDVKKAWGLYGQFTPYKGGPMWKVGEYAKVVKPGNVSGKAARVVGYDGDQLRMRYADGKEITAAHSWLQGIQPQSQTHAKLAFDKVPVSELKPGDVIGHPSYGGAYGQTNPIVFEGIEGEQAVGHSWGSPNTPYKTKFGSFSEVEVIVTARQIAGFAGNAQTPSDADVQDTPPPPHPEPSNTVDMNSLSVGTVFTLADAKKKPAEPWVVAKHDPADANGFVYAKQLDSATGDPPLPFGANVKVVVVTPGPGGEAPSTTSDPGWQPPSGTIGTLKIGDRFVFKGGVMEVSLPEEGQQPGGFWAKVIVPVDATNASLPGTISSFDTTHVPDKVWYAPTPGPTLEPNTHELALAYLPEGTHFTLDAAQLGGDYPGVVWRIPNAWKPGNMSIEVEPVSVPEGVDVPFASMGVSPYALPLTISAGTAAQHFKDAPLYSLEPGSQFKAEGVSGVPDGTYELMPQGYKPPPGMVDTPGEDAFPLWAQNVETGDLEWFGEELAVEVVALPTGSDVVAPSSVAQDKVPGDPVEQAGNLAPGDYIASGVAGNIYRVDNVTPSSGGNVEITATLVASEGMKDKIGGQHTLQFVEHEFLPWTYAEEPDTTPAPDIAPDMSGQGDLSDILNPYLWPKSGKKKYPQIGTLQPGAKFRDKNGKSFTVKGAGASGWVHYVDAEGVEHATPAKSRVFVLS